jgi:hypothetical protein
MGLSASVLRFRVHKSSPLDSILSQVNPFHTLIFNFNIVSSSTPRSPKWTLHSRFSYENNIRSYLFHTCYMSHPSHSNNIWSQKWNQLTPPEYKNGGRTVRSGLQFIFCEINGNGKERKLKFACADVSFLVLFSYKRETTLLSIFTLSATFQTSWWSFEKISPVQGLKQL